MVVKLSNQLSLPLSLPATLSPLPRHLTTIPRLLLSAGAHPGAVVVGGEGEEAAEIQIPTIKTIKIKVKIPLTKRLIIINHIKKAQNTQTYLPVLGGPVLSTGRKAAELRTAVTL